jgi:hypothetical protein
MKILFGIDIGEFLAELSEEEKTKHQKLVWEIRQLFYTIEDALNNPDPDEFSEEEKTEITKDLAYAVFELYSLVDQERDAFGRGISISLYKSEIKSYNGQKIDWEKAITV